MPGQPPPASVRRRRDGDPSTGPLAEVAARFKVGTASAAELFAAFMAARLYLHRPARPGMITIALAGERVAPVFSSEMELARFGGPADWFSTDGFDVVATIPPGVIIGLDLAAPHRLRIDPAAIRLEQALFLPHPGNRRPGDVVDRGEPGPPS